MAAGDIVLITGANKGIGFESARQLGKLGYKVLVGARDAALGEAAVEKLRAEGAAADFVLIDVTNASSVAAAAKEVEAKYGRLDVLVNNAGVFNHPNADPKNVNLELTRKDFEVNFFGVITVTNAFLPLVLKADVPRIVNLSSILGSHAEHEDPKSMIYGYTTASYNATKAALNMFTQNLAHSLRDTKAKVNSAHPGWVKTDMGGDAAPYEVAEGAETTVYLATLDADGPTGGFFHKKERVRW